ncbi:hypothetical protein OVA13_14955 [Pseudoxanthomonas sp. SL93]|uniref:hypothetical protein n=1 Tax=Pseudoxanthomonas sp. SL93 TaxID=2995142 RepID=UPI00226E935F|nr:hypothetical protein [Pseudoxanthomonas sp. SL93]WAC62677.1 hypothetical protein OVA13_14955 [Pseudoxanthomonas sp. SL93]
MDEFSVSGATAPAIGDEFDLELISFLDDDETWEEMFSGNPDRKLDLESLGGWRYRAYGQVIQIEPVIVDCGLTRIEGPVQSNDARLVGEYLAFSVARLSGRGYMA